MMLITTERLCMTRLNESTVNTERLKRLYGVNPCAKALLNHAAKRKNNANITTVDRLLAIIVSEENTVVTRQQLIEVLREFEKLECGRFVTGRRGQPSRFVWAVQIASLGKAAIGEASVVTVAEPAMEQVPEEPELSQIRNGLITHSYQLRPEVGVSLGLPANLTPKEANRLAEFIRTLPFDDVGGAV